jgi:hypothetical protein
MISLFRTLRASQTTARTALVAVALSALASTSGAQSHSPQFEITFPAAAHAQPITGRVYLFLTTDNSSEPRFQGGSLGLNGPFFGKDVSELRPGATTRIDASTPGFPFRSLDDLAPGDYYVQAVINVYTQFHRADGHTIWAHMDQWEGQQPMVSPGNLVSGVQRIHISSAAGPSQATVRINADKVIPPVQVPADTKWIKHVKIQSKLLTAFWGHPIYLGAVVLLPKDYDEHPDVRYPVDYEQDHFSLAPPYHFQSENPGLVDSLKKGRRAWLINMRQNEGYQLYRDWTSADFPRMLMVTFLHPTPYFDDSYAVNSANNGPYGDAIMTELIPYIETHFRIIQKPYARVLSGGSTGGWESLALQVQHPKFFGGAWVYYPDPIDFRQWALVDIYRDNNAFSMPGAKWIVPDRPMMRSSDGQVLITERQQGHLESVLGSRGRSAEQQEVWEAVYGPVGPDGYPVPLWDKQTGRIDHTVAAYMRDHGYDLSYYLQHNWAKLGPDLVGKLHFYVGDMDNFYLNMAVYKLDDFLSHTTNPAYGGSFQYGRPLKGHGFRPTTTGVMLRAMADQITRNASPGPEREAWRYH